MLNSIIKRHSKINPLSDTEIQILKAASRLFLKQGFSKTTHRQIAAESGIGLGVITYHYKVKEDMLRVLIEELIDYHLDIIEKAAERSKDSLFAYALEIAVQIALCENDPKAWDLYFAAYSHLATFDYIKDWAAKKNFHMLHDKFPDMTEEDFRRIENVTSGIELAAFSAPCDRYFTLEKKIALFLDSMMLLYNISEEERKQTIEKILKLDCVKLGNELFEKFIKKLDNTEKQTD